MQVEVEVGRDSKIFPLAKGSLATTILELTQQANNYNLVKRGANEAAKTLNRGTSDLIILAADAEPIALVLHLPLLCEDKNVPYVFVPSRAALGRACGCDRAVSAVAILRAEDGKLKSQVEAVRDKIDQLLI